MSQATTPIVKSMAGQIKITVINKGEDIELSFKFKLIYEY